MSRKSRAKRPSPFRSFSLSPEVIRLVVMMYVRFPLSLRIVEDLLFERGIDISHETVRQWWNRFGPMFAGDMRRQRVSRMRGFRHWRWRFDEMYVKLNGEMVHLWRAVDHKGEILHSYITRTRDKDAALRFIKKALKRHGSPEAITTDGLRSYRAAMNELGNAKKQEIGRWTKGVSGFSCAVGIMGKKESQYASTQGTRDPQRASRPTAGGGRPQCCI